jgi:hypothetical protein
MFTMTDREKILTGEIILKDAVGETADILIAGDFYMGNRTKELCSSGEYHKIYNEVLPTLKEKDLSIVNLENPLIVEEHPIDKIGPPLHAHPDCVKALQFGGFDLATLANNHILDHGSKGLESTIAACTAGNIQTVGAGLTSKDITAPLIISVKSTRIGIINATENEFSTIRDGESGANAIDPVELYDQIIEAKKKTDILFLILHGGHEFYPLPSPTMVRLYRHFSDLGVSAIIGHHPHCATGFEIRNGIPIFYSLGNFVFDWHEPQDEIWYNGYFVKLKVDHSSVVRIRIFPYRQFKNDVGLHLLEGRDRSAFFETIAEYSRIIEDNESLKSHWEKFCDSKKNEYLKILFRLNRIETALLKRGIVTEHILPRTNQMMLMNLMRCEAHRDLSVEILKRFIAEGKR